MQANDTVRCGLFGWPVGHSISPRIHNAGFAAAGLDWSYRAIPVPPDKLKAALARFRGEGGRGLNITIPHKIAVMELLDELHPHARLLGAVNTVLFSEGIASGFNTDGPGFIWALKEQWGFSPRGKLVVVLGAGGAGRAVAVQTALEGGRVEISDLDRGKAEWLSGWINREVSPGVAGVYDAGTASGKNLISAADLLVDATPLGLDPSDPAGFDPDLLSSGAAVVDLVYNPPETALLQAARRRGLKAINGLGMLFYQAALSWEIWTGRPAPLEEMKTAALRALDNPDSEVGL